jgi:hypothetical protein
MNIGGYTGMWTDGGLTYQYPEYTLQVSDNFSHVRGRHTFKFGADVQAYSQEVRQGGPKLTAPLGNPLGTFNFSGQWTGNQGWPGQPHSQGNAFADLLLGVADSSNYGIAPTDIQIGSRDWEFYAQDTWQAAPKLTLNVGLRYKYQQPWRVRDDRVSYLDLTNNKLALPQDSSTVTAPPEAFPQLLAAYPFETTQNARWPKSCYVPRRRTLTATRFRLQTVSWQITSGAGRLGDLLRQPHRLLIYARTFNPPWQLGATYHTAARKSSRAVPAGRHLQHPSRPPLPARRQPIRWYVADRACKPDAAAVEPDAGATVRRKLMARVTYVARRRLAGCSTSDIMASVQQPNVPPQRQVTCPAVESGAVYVLAAMNFDQLNWNYSSASAMASSSRRSTTSRAVSMTRRSPADRRTRGTPQPTMAIPMGCRARRLSSTSSAMCR